MVAVRMDVNESGLIEDVAIAVGSCSAVAQRLSVLEAALLGRRVDSHITTLVSGERLLELSPIDDVRASAEYRNDAVQTLIVRALHACLSAQL